MPAGTHTRTPPAPQRRMHANADHMHVKRLVIAPDFPKLTLVQRTTYKLALAYFFSGDDKFAERCAAGLRAFFLDDATGMTPNLRYAQLIPGSEEAVGAPFVRSSCPPPRAPVPHAPAAPAPPPSAQSPAPGRF